MCSLSRRRPMMGQSIKTCRLRRTPQQCGWLSRSATRSLCCGRRRRRHLPREYHELWTVCNFAFGLVYALYVVWTSVLTICNFAFGLLYCIDCCMELYRLLYGFVSTIVWIWFEYCMDLYRILSGFVSTYIWTKHCIFDCGHIYAINKKNSMKDTFAVCQGQGTRQMPLFAVCQAVTVHGKRHFQWGSEHCILFCRGPRKALGKVFAVCPKCSTRQTSSLSAVVCRALFAVCYTRQTLCRV